MPLSREAFKAQYSGWHSPQEGHAGAGDAVRTAIKIRVHKDTVLPVELHHEYTVILASEAAELVSRLELPDLVFLHLRVLPLPHLVADGLREGWLVEQRATGKGSADLRYFQRVGYPTMSQSQFIAQMKADILRSGKAFVHSGTEATYTLGLSTTYHHPEVLVWGYPIDERRTILENTCYLIARGTRLTPGLVLPHLAEAVDEQPIFFRVEPVSVEALAQVAPQALVYNPLVEMFILLWSDQAGNWPETAPPGSPCARQRLFYKEPR